MNEDRLNDFLAADEELMLSFSADSVTEGGSDGSQTLANQVENAGESSSHIFGATDRRIVYLDGSGGFKDIDYQHISSIETGTEEDNSEVAGGLALGCCGGILSLGGLGAIVDSPGVAIVVLFFGVGMLIAAVNAFQNAETTERQEVTFITGDESSQRIEVTVSEDAGKTVGAELSRILREQRR